MNSVLFGRVVDEDGGPVEGVTVGVYQGGTSILPHLKAQERLDIESTTTQEGNYDLVGIGKGGTYTVVASHPDYAEATSRPIRIKKSVRHEVPDIVLGHGTTVKGKVTDNFGNAIAGARVGIQDPIGFAFQSEDERKPWKIVMTNDAGFYSIENVYFKSFEITASAEGFGTQRKTNNVQFEAKREKTVDFMMSRGSFISGFVTDLNGGPMAEVRIEATLVQNKEYSSSGIAFSENGGAFKVADLAEGKYVLRATKDGFSDVVNQSVESGVTDLNLIMKPRGGISGYVRDLRTNDPVKEFQIRAFLGRTGRPAKRSKTAEVFKSEDGFYSITNLEPGNYSFKVSADGYADTSSDEVTIVRDYVIDNVDIFMNKGGELSGRVKDITGTPLKGVKVTLNTNKFQDTPLYQIFSAMSGSQGTERKKTTFTKSDGTFYLDLIIPDLYQVAFSHDDYSTKAINDVKVMLGETSQLGNIVLSPGCKVEGIVYDSAGECVAGSDVVITQETAFMRQTSTDKEGYYVFNHLIPGEYRITVQVNRVQGKSIDNIFKRLMIAEKSKVTIYLEEGESKKTDIHLVE